MGKYFQISYYTKQKIPIFLYVVMHRFKSIMSNVNSWDKISIVDTSKQSPNWNQSFLMIVDQTTVSFFAKLQTSFYLYFSAKKILNNQSCSIKQNKRLLFVHYNFFWSCFFCLKKNERNQLIQWNKFFCSTKYIFMFLEIHLN